MSQQPGNGRVRWVKDDGVVQGPSDVLAAGTYYAELGGEAAGVAESWHFVYDATLVADITWECSNIPRGDLATHAAAASGWVAVPAITTVSPAASAAQAFVLVGGNGAKRFRAKIVVVTQGVISGYLHHKG